MKKRCVFGIIFCFFIMFSQSIEANGENPAAYNIIVDSGFDDTGLSSHVAFDVYVDNNPGFQIGTARSDVFLFKMSNKVNHSVSYDYFLVAYKITVKPKVSAKKHGIFFNYYGWSEALYVSSQMPAGAKLVSLSPVTQNPVNSYNVGIDFSSSYADPIGAKISGEISVIESSLRINNRSDIDKGLFSIKYDYMCDISHSKSYLTKETQQYGMFIAEVSKGTAYRPVINVEMCFAPADGWSNFVQVAVTSRYSNRTSFRIE